MSSNLLQGEIPSGFGLMENLEYLNLSRNRLSGSIPSNFKYSYRLQNVDVSQNHLQGPIPENEAFQSAPVESLRGNRGLCGNASGLQPRKPDGRFIDTYKKGNRKVIVLTLSLVLGSLLPSLVGLGVFLLRKKYLRALASKRVNIIKGVAHAMAYLHHDCSPPILHRDISSNNVLLDSEFEPRVSDFGTAKILTLDHTSWSSVVGTYGYIAPELAYTTKATEKSDVYSFGVLALEVIKGRHPGDTISSLVYPAAAEDLCVRDDLWDPRLPAPNVNTIDKLMKIIEIALSCLISKPELRPTVRNISEVLTALVRKTNPRRSPILASTNT